MDLETNTQQQLPFNPQIQYEQCPHCSRKFFMGKLTLHLKLCNAENPMLISPRKTPHKNQGKFSSESKQTTAHRTQHKCPKCSAKLPSFLYEKHLQKCQEGNHSKYLEEANKKSQNQSSFNDKAEILLPFIKQSTKESYQFKKPILKDIYKVRLREELSCFRKAEEIKEIQCSSCGRFFSKAASLRHIPICQALRAKQMYQNTFKRRKQTPKSMVLQQLRIIQSQRHKKSRSCLYKRELTQKKIEAKEQKSLVQESIAQN